MVAVIDLVSCPSLTHLSIIGNISLRQSVMMTISKAVRDGRLPNLEGLSFVQVKVTNPLKYFLVARQSYLCG